MLDPRIKERLWQARAALDAQGKLPSPDALEHYRMIFRQRFGPAVLAQLDGAALLETMHGRTTHDNLMYWLEFKDDEEFPALFGGIGGGSALKFGLYQRQEDGAWMTGSPARRRELSIPEAIAMATRQRDQLLACVQTLEHFSRTDDDAAYAWLQQALDHDGPDVSNTGWAHKYFSLLFPDLLDAFHNADWQRFHLLRLLVHPPAGQGRYCVTGRFVALAEYLRMPLTPLAKILLEANGTPYRYWRVGTTDGQGTSYWGLMRHESVMAIGWPLVGNLTDFPYAKAAKEDLRYRIMQAYPEETPAVAGRSAQKLFNFLHHVTEGDLVVAGDGMQVLGIGRVQGPYTFREKYPFPHCRDVDWLVGTRDRLPDPHEGLMSTLQQLTNPDNLLELEHRVLIPAPLPVAITPETHPTPLTGWPARIAAVVQRKGQAILYGPPGTGKTYWALQTACELAARGTFARAYAHLTADQRAQVETQLVAICTFHPAYGYEAFLEGYHPELVEGHLAFTRRDGLFLHLCREATAHPDAVYVLVIDEINRGDIPRIFGELLTVLEKDKRGLPITLPVSGDTLRVPKNLFLIGTMNTADRSIALLDAALRRRFGFLELMPDITVLGQAMVDGIPLGPWLAALNTRIRTCAGRDARHLQIGHAYLLDGQGHPVADLPTLARVVREDLIPLLEEYCYGDIQTLTDILGLGLVDQEAQGIREAYFTATGIAELPRVLLAPFPEVIASQAAVDADAEEAEEAVDATAG